MEQSRGWKRDASIRATTLLEHGNSSSSAVGSEYDGENIMCIVALVFVVLVLIVVIPSASGGSQATPAVQNIIERQAAQKNMTLHTTVDVPPVLQHRSYAGGRESLGEAETRAALQRIFGKTFVKVRPTFLINPESHRKLELDCFNAELRLGVEYSGFQHYVFPNAFHKTQQEFDAQQRRDRYKSALCQQAGVHLVVVPYTIPRGQIEAFLRDQLRNLFVLNT